jgi:lipoprotein NlpD
MASHWGRRTLLTTVCAASAWALIGCATPHQAPVEDHAAVRPGTRPAVSATDTNKVASAADNSTPDVETRNPTYTVKPGDSLRQIALDFGQNWRDLARWNNLADPDHIEVGQTLKVIAPTGEVGTAATLATTTSAATFKPLPPQARASDAKAADSKANGSALTLPPAATAATATPSSPPRARATTT